MAMLVLKNGAGEPEVIIPIGSPSRTDQIPVARDASFDHLKSHNLRFGPPAACPRARIAPNKSPLSSLSQRASPALKDIDRFGNLVPVEAHACFQPQRVARAQSARPDAELRARLEKRVPHFYRRRFVVGM